jgi:hypothetical protein
MRRIALSALFALLAAGTSAEESKPVFKVSFSRSGMRVDFISNRPP